MKQVRRKSVSRRPVLTAAVTAILAGFLSLPAAAQIGINLKTDRAKYFRYEPIQADVTLRNVTGNPLLFGEGDAQEGYLKITIEDAQGAQLIADDPKINPAAGLILGAGETKSVTIMLNELFDLQKEGSYTVRAVVGHARLANDFRSDPVTVTVTAGRLVWSRGFGIPTTDSTKPIVSRKASLFLFPDQKHDLYALFLEDDRVVYGVVRLGPRISGATPQCDVDALSNIHVLVMTKPRLVDYQVYDSNLRLKQRRFYMVDSSVPMLQRDPDVGRVMVVGGRLAQEGTDYTLEDTKEGGATGAPPGDAPGAPAPPATPKAGP